jgi:dipeptidyl aminopeptidase/acylaminoacyl peptidase
MAAQTAPYGSWKSPISAELAASAALGFGQIVLDGDDLYWLEMRPREGGRGVIVRRRRDGSTADVTPPPFNARTRVHEYGGGDFAVRDGTVYFSNFADQQLYRQPAGAPPQAITSTPGRRYADAIVDAARHRLICVCEDHTGGTGEPASTLIPLSLDGSSEHQTLAGGNDFYASPRLSPDGARLAWLTWNHPNMPWDGTELWIGEFDAGGALGGARCIAGGPEESVFQPEWSPNGVLHFVSDRTGWWNLYRWQEQQIEPLCEMAADFGRPQWQFGMSTYAFESRNRLICSYTERGSWSLARLGPAVGVGSTGPLPVGSLQPAKSDRLLGHAARQFQQIAAPYSEIADIRAAHGAAVFRGGAPTEPTAIIRLHLESRQFEVLRRSSDISIDCGYLAAPEPIEFPTAGGLTAHAFFYRPHNRDYVAPGDEKPPLLVRCHGGPTSAASSALDLRTQYWTSRGVAVLDVNYGGSTGFGRAYRQRLNGHWGVVDVDDCVNGALFLVGQGEVDAGRLAISGGSAGGYTTLCALTFRDIFKAGASYYGISDLEALAADTHKFESRYEDRLVGPYPQCRDLYRLRSPLHFADRLSCPVIFFQGLDDKVVPPNQTEAMVAALRSKGVPVAYIAFPGEQHGFRRAETIKRALEGEFYFYARVFGFQPADAVEPIVIENLRPT